MNITFLKYGSEAAYETFSSNLPNHHQPIRLHHPYKYFHQEVGGLKTMME
jgi:hypothetical protein